MNDEARIDDPDTDAFWAAAREQRLVYGRCQRCVGVVFYVRRSCPHCGASAVELEESAGNGTVYCATVVRRHPMPQFREECPFTLAWVDFDEGFRMLTRVLGDSDDAAIGARVKVAFVEHGGQLLPCVKPGADAA